MREKLEAHGAGLTLEELASALRITTRSVRRYLRELALVTEIESIALRPGGAHVWRIKPSERGRTVVLRRTQAYALLAARRVFEVLRGSALFDEVDLALREIEQLARRPATRAAPLEAGADAKLEDRFAYLPPSAQAYAHRSDELDEVFRAVAELRVLRFRGRGGGIDAPDRPPRITIHPYALVLHGGAIQCVAHDVDAAETRVFPLDGMSEVEASEDERFELPPEFALRDWIHGDFGVGVARRTIKLLVEFEPRVGESVRSRRVHPSQKVAVAGDGRVRASIQIPESREVLDRVKSWVLGFGASARVLEPRVLADEIALELRRAAERYR